MTIEKKVEVTDFDRRLWKTLPKKVTAEIIGKSIPTTLQKIRKDIKETMTKCREAKTPREKADELYSLSIYRQGEYFLTQDEHQLVLAERSEKAAQYVLAKEKAQYQQQ